LPQLRQPQRVARCERHGPNERRETVVNAALAIPPTPISRSTAIPGSRSPPTPVVRRPNGGYSSPRD
jgi:hypothetical protein